MSLAVSVETGVKGLTPNQIESNTQTDFIGQSGRKLRLFASPSDLQIRDDQYPNVRLLANLDGKVFSVDVLTKSTFFTSGKHPDFYAGSFVGFALNYFQRIADVEFYKSLWWGNSDNYAQWQTAMSKGLSPKDALNETWAGRVRAQIGFNRLVRFEMIENLKRKDSLVTSVVARD
jgi:hypothetical protein